MLSWQVSRVRVIRIVEMVLPAPPTGKGHPGGGHFPQRGGRP
jgi:hypothetical protein